MSQIALHLRRIARAIRFHLYPIPVLTRLQLRRFGAAHKCAIVLDRVCLDIGAGTNAYRNEILKTFESDLYFALDIVASEMTSVVADARSLPIRDQAMSHVVALETLQHIPDVGRAFDELYRVLKPGGLLFISFPFLFGECEPTDCYRWTMQGMESELTRRGFRILESQRRGGIFFALASGLHLAVQLVIPGGRSSWRRPLTAWSLLRSIVVTILTIPTLMLGWLALGLDQVLRVKTLDGFYQGGVVLAERQYQGAPSRLAGESSPAQPTRRFDGIPTIS